MLRSQITLQALLNIKAEFGNGKNCYTGICRQYIEYSKRTESDLYPYFKTWDEFSGDLEYPVPGGASAYNNHGHSMFSKTTRYGRLRHNLLNHCIREAQKDAANDL